MFVFTLSAVHSSCGQKTAWNSFYFIWFILWLLVNFTYFCISNVAALFPAWLFYKLLFRKQDRNMKPLSFIIRHYNQISDLIRWFEITLHSETGGELLHSSTSTLSSFGWEKEKSNTQPTATCSPGFMRKCLLIQCFYMGSQTWLSICTCQPLRVYIPSHLWIFIFTLHMPKVQQRTQELYMNCSIFFTNGFLYLSHLDGADVWKHNFTAHGVLFECCTPVSSFVMVLTDFIFQNDITPAFCVVC